MTQANRITLARIAIAPLFFLLFQLAWQQWLHIPAALQIAILLLLLLLYGLSEFSDLLDGMIARRLHQVSGLGKLLDPFGDVLSRVTYFFCFYQVGIMPTYAFILILWREMGMLFVRQLTQLYGQGPLSARWAGKVKAGIYFGISALSLLLFLFLYWPGAGLEQFRQQFFTTAGLGRGGAACPYVWQEGYSSWPVVLYALLRAWLLPLGFLAAVVASWYSFLLYLKDLIPVLRSGTPAPRQ